MLRLGADRTLLRIAFVFMRRRIPRQTGNGAVLTRSPAGDGGVLFLTLALSALSLVSGAVADSRGTLPHDGAVDRDCELARHVRFDRSHHR